MAFIATAIGIGAAGSIAGGLIASSGAKSAANTAAASADAAAQLQYQSGQNALAFNRDVFNTQQANGAPWLKAGAGGLLTLQNLLGVNQPVASSSAAPVTSSTVPSGGGLMPYGTGDGTTTRRFDSGQSAVGTSRFLAPGDTLDPGAGEVLPSVQSPSVLSPVAGATAANTGLPNGYLGTPPTFTAPTDVTQQNDPGYQFRLSEGMKLLQNSAAAKGGLLSGGTAKALQQYGQNFASNEYGNVYGRAMDQYNVARTNQNDIFNRYAALSGIGQTAANQLASSGNNAASNNSSILLNSGQQIGNSMQNAGMARASGYQNAGNIYGNMVSGLGAIPGQYAMLQNMGYGGGGNSNLYPTYPGNFPSSSWGVLAEG